MGDGYLVRQHLRRNLARLWTLMSALWELGLPACLLLSSSNRCAPAMHAMLF